MVNIDCLFPFTTAKINNTLMVRRDVDEFFGYRFSGNK